MLQEPNIRVFMYVDCTNEFLTRLIANSVHIQDARKPVPNKRIAK